MRIIYLHQYFNTPEMIGGTRSYEMARRLVAMGHEVNMVTTWRESDNRKGWFETQEAGIRVHWLPIPYSNAMSFNERIRAFVRFSLASTWKAVSLHGDLVFATSTPLTIAIPAILTSWFKRIPMVFEVRDMWPDVPIALGVLNNSILIWLAKRLEMLAYDKAARVVALAPGMREDIIKKGVSGDKISVIPNGCDFRKLPDESENTSLRNRFSWIGQRKLVIYAGAIGMANGVDYLVRLAREVMTLDPEIRFVVFGDGKEWDYVSNLAVTLGVLNQNFFMFHAIPRNRIASWLGAADMHVALMKGPSKYLKDAVNNKFFDALSLGKPIANNFFGWQTRIAEEAGIGLVLDSDNLTEAAGRLVDTLHAEDWLKNVTNKAHCLAFDKFNLDNLASQLENEFKSAVQSR